MSMVAIGWYRNPQRLPVGSLVTGGMNGIRQVTRDTKFNPKRLAVITDVDKMRVIQRARDVGEVHIAEVKWLKDLPALLLWTFDEDELQENPT